MTTRSNKSTGSKSATKSAGESTAKAKAKTSAKRAASPATPPPGETVLRYEVPAACFIALSSVTETELGEPAMKALTEAMAKCGFVGTVQCEGYVFNLTLLPVLHTRPADKPAA